MNFYEFVGKIGQHSTYSINVRALLLISARYGRRGANKRYFNL